MKKRIFALSIPVLILCTLTSCGHRHTYTQEVVAPTCTEDGYTIYTCECGDTYQDDVVPMTGHDYDEGVLVEATCTEDGYLLYTCKNDNSHTKKEVVSEKLGHLGLPEETVKDANCTEDGLKEVKCERCNAILETTVIPALGHTSSVKTIDIEPTCTEEGHYYFKCDNCDYILTEGSIDALGHDTKEIIETEATCTEDGVKKTICERCGKTLETTIIPALGHNIITTPASEATCITSGSTGGSYCNRCGEVFEVNETIAPLGHSYTKTAMTTSAGHSYNDYKCSRCAYEYRDDLTTDYTKLNGYLYLKNNYTNGESYAKLYKDMYDAYTTFLATTTDYTVSSSSSSFKIASFTINCGLDSCTKATHHKYNITLAEAAAVWRMVYIDNPQFMFLWNGYTHGTTTCSSLFEATYENISLVISKEYATYAYRKQVMDGLSTVNEKIASDLKGVNEDEYKALAIHDFICNRIYYAHEADGTTASKAKNDHDMVGFILDGHGVCETYSKTFLYYSYLYDFTAIIVTSDSHMWNMVKFYDTWYGMDLTWDDGTKIKYTYFGCNETTMNKSTAHTPCSSDFGINFQVPIPTMSDTSCTVSGGIISVPSKPTSTTQNCSVIYFKKKETYTFAFC